MTAATGAGEPAASTAADPPGTRGRVLRWCLLIVSALVVLEVVASMVAPTVVPRLRALPEPARSSCGAAWEQGELFWTETQLSLPTAYTADDGTVYQRDLDADCELVGPDGQPLPGPGD